MKTSDSLKTTAGSAALVLMIVNVTSHVTGWSERWYALAVAIFIALGAALISKASEGMFSKLFFGTLNGFMIYAAAFGVQNSLIAADPHYKEVRTLEETKISIPLHGTKDAAGNPRVVHEIRTKEGRAKVEVKPDTRQFNSPW
jgi:hypothetical protein